MKNQTLLTSSPQILVKSIIIARLDTFSTEEQKVQ